jgi:diguanylate cyclase (GGDEF)-like protein
LWTIVENGAKETKTSRRRTGIGFRLALLSVGVVLVVMGVAGFLLMRAQEHRAIEEAIDRGAALLGTLAVPCASSIANGNTEQLDGYLAEVAGAGRRHMGLISVTMMDHLGHIQATSAAGALGQASLTKSFRARATQAEQPIWRRFKSENGSSVLEVSMPAVSGLRWGTLVAAFDMRPLEARIAWTRLVLALVALGFAVTMGIVLYIGLSRIVVTPIRQLGRAAEAIEQGDLNARVEINSHDELGLAASAFNNMASELQTYTQSLERKVEERSAEVRHKNDELEILNTRLKDAISDLETLVVTDPLTGVYNRRHFNEVIEFEFRRSARASHPLTLIMVDVDHFKRFNDTFGHQAGDEILRHVAQVLEDTIRTTDILARYGGEEFVLLLLDTPGKVAEAIGEKLRVSLESYSFPVGRNKPLAQVTVSVGVASFPEDADNSEDLLERADRAMYAAKAAGRNCVEVWSERLESLDFEPS